MDIVIEIDEALVRRAIERSGLPGPREVIEEALRIPIRLHAQRAVAEMFGKFPLTPDWGVTEDGARP